MSDDPYEPVACSLHDRFEHAAVRRAKVRIEWDGPAGSAEVSGVITDIGPDEGAEYLTMSGGERIRLDWVRSFQEE